MKYAVIGAGLAGLVAARELSRADSDAHIDVFEGSDRIGGKLYTVPYDCGPVDVGAEAFLAFRQDAVDYFTDLGLADKIVHPSGLGSLIYSGGKLHPMPHQTVMGIPAAAAVLGDLVDGDTAARIEAEKDADPIDWDTDGDMSIGELVGQRFGTQVVERVVCAFLGGVYSCHANDLGVRATVPQLAKALDDLVEHGDKVTLTAACLRIDEKRRKAAEKQTATTPKTRPVFGSFTGGYATLYEALADDIRGDIYLETFITAIDKTEAGYRLTGAPGDGCYDRIVLATPAPMTAQLLTNIAPEAATALKTVRLASSVVVGMKFARDPGLPDNSGVLVATDEGLHAKAFTFSSKKWPHLAERGGALVRASFGRLGDDTAMKADDDTLVDWALEDLRTITGVDGIAAGLDEIFVQKWWGGIPQYGPDHLATVDKATAAIAGVDGLAVAGSWVRGVGVPAVIAQAREAAKNLAAKQ
ncbi:protoporphyrinogen oxidase [Corynebacterium mendelii]|uniref:Coproporphyrinogen III oxidase n=1 Tax=Corynebacterium mendelii TaxID=2765362 RepID=A0A939DZV3_9CORY|nr:protoporphyrinogen oxidase [Corynebacterium mendelii]MBN9643886.1 protoporphyrinogen oxidase [Corynebacterium mendelii]